MTVALVSDVAVSLGRPISDTVEQAQVQAWLDRVESRIRRRIPTLDTLALDADYAATLLGVEVDVVIRRINNPEGKISEGIDDYTYRRNSAAASADLWPTAEEWVELTPVRTSGAYSIRPQLSA